MPLRVIAVVLRSIIIKPHKAQAGYIRALAYVHIDFIYETKLSEQLRRQRSESGGGFPFAFFPPAFSSSLGSSTPKIQLGGLGERCEFPQRSRRRSSS